MFGGRFTYRFLTGVVVVTAFYGEGCSPDSKSQTGIATIAGEGGTATLAGVASVFVPANAFAEPTEIQITQIRTPLTAPDVGEIITFLGARTVSKDSVQVRLGAKQPTMPIRISVIAGADYIVGRPAELVARVLGATENESDTEQPYPTVNLLDTRTDAARSMISFDAGPTFFAQQNRQRQHVGTFTLALVPGRN